MYVLLGYVWLGLFLVPVLPGCERLVAVWLLFLPPTGLHRNLLHTHVLWDAQSQKRHAHCTERPHETGIQADDCRARPLHRCNCKTKTEALSSINICLCVCSGGKWRRRCSASCWSSLSAGFPYISAVFWRKQSMTKMTPTAVNCSGRHADTVCDANTLQMSWEPIVLCSVTSCSLYCQLCPFPLPASC